MFKRRICLKVYRIARLAGIPNEHRHITIKKRTAMYHKYFSSLGTT